MHKIKRVILGVAGFVLFAGIFTWNSKLDTLAARAGTQSITPSANINSSIMISVPSTPVSLNIRPSSSGTSGSTSTFNVVTYSNDSAGYTLYMNVTSTNLTSAEGYTIPTITGTASNGYTINNIEVNHWGVSCDTSSTVYCKDLSRFRAASATPIEIESFPTVTGGSGNGTQIKIGAKLDLNTVPGEYMTTLNFTVVGNISVTNISQVSYMQEFAAISAEELADVKSSMISNQQYQLKDSRDQKTYYVAKLADGNVWMTQNLDHDILSSRTYTSVDTDIPSNWKPMFSTSTGTLLSYSTMEQSYDPGDVCWGNGSTCSDNHYKIGNYYNFTAAIAMNDSSSYVADGTVINQSICPAGWTLPLNGHSTGSLDYLLTSSGIAFVAGAIDSPVYLALSGYVTSSNTYGLANEFHYMTKVVKSSSHVYEFRPQSSGSTVQQENYYGYRDAGYSVRCVAR